MEYIYNISIVCVLIKTLIFSQEIFHKERIPAESHEENDALSLIMSCFSKLLYIFLIFGGGGPQTLFSLIFNIQNFYLSSIVLEIFEVWLEESFGSQIFILWFY